MGSEPNLEVLPEGTEDIDILVQGRMIETIQVKSYPTLNFLHLTAGKRHPRISRIQTYLRLGDTIKISVANFGNISRELAEPLQGSQPEDSSLMRKLEHVGFSPAERSAFLEQVHFIGLDEDSVSHRIRTALAEQPVGIDPEIAFELLTLWLYQKAESSVATSQGELIGQLSRIGKFLAERHAHHAEWFTSITPLEDRCTIERERLQTEFSEGIAARYEHILARLDIPRPHIIKKIHSSWGSSNVVIIRAPSGQGKTTIALRYLHDYYPDQWRFKVELIQDRHHALRVARALSGFATAIRLNIAVYIDVSPRDVDWPELVQRLAALKNLRILVSVREEDFQRAHLSGAEFLYKDVQLTFDQAEAKRFFERARSVHSVQKYLDFTEAWVDFGGRGPLLEFVHLLVQSASLRDRLKSQLKRVRSEVSLGTRHRSELLVLQVVSVATALEARVNTRLLQTLVNHPDLTTCLEGFQNEYLVRLSSDGSFIEGLHPVRSQMLAEILTDRELCPWVDLAEKALQVIDEIDAEIFLLRSLSAHPDIQNTLLLHARSRSWSSWSGFAGVLRAHAWAHKYAEAFAMKPEVLAKEIGAWLTSSAGHRPKPPKSGSDWLGLGWVWYFLASVRLPVRRYLQVPQGAMKKAVERLPLKSLASIAMSMYLADASAYRRWWHRHRKEVMRRLAVEYSVARLAHDGDVLFVHYLFNLGLREGKDSINAHGATMERIWLVRQLRPDFPKYGAKAYGHDFDGEFTMAVDDTMKSGIPVRMLPPPIDMPWRSLGRNLRDWMGRPESWTDFSSAIIERRRSITTVLRLFVSWAAEGADPSTLLTRCESLREDLASTQALPKPAVDSLGFASENASSEHTEMVLFAGRAMLMERYKPIVTCCRDLAFYVSCFIQQAPLVVGGHGEENEDNLHYLSLANLRSTRGALRDLQCRFRELLASLVDEPTLREVEDSENSILETLWPLWWSVAVAKQGKRGSVRRASEFSSKLVSDTYNELIQILRVTCSSSSGDAIAVVHELQEGINPRIWIEFQVSSPIKMADSERRLVDALNVALHATTPQDLMWHVAEDNLLTTYIVPTYLGRALDKSAWQYNTATTLFGSLDRGDPSLWWKWFRRPVDDEAWCLFGLRCWDTPQLESLRCVHESLTEAWTIGLWGRSCSRVEEFDPVCKPVIDNAADSKIHLFGNAVERATGEICSILEYWSGLSDDDRDHHPSWSEVVSALFEVLNFLNNDGGAEDSRCDESIASEFLVNMKQAVGAAAACTLLWVFGIQEAALAEEL